MAKIWPKMARKAKINPGWPRRGPRCGAAFIAKTPQNTRMHAYIHTPGFEIRGVWLWISLVVFKNHHFAWEGLIFLIDFKSKVGRARLRVFHALVNVCMHCGLFAAVF